MGQEKRSIGIAAIQMVSGPDVEQNLTQAYQLVRQAAMSGADLVALPEYFCLLCHDETAKVRMAETPGKGLIQDWLAMVAKEFGIWVCGGTLPIASNIQGKVFNTSFLYSPEGVQVARYDKLHLFRFTSEKEQFDESRTIAAGNGTVVADTVIGRIGMSVCYDLRFPELYRAMGTVDLILVPSAFTYTTGQAHWETLLRARAIENQCYVLAPAQGGVHPSGRRTWGHSMLVDPWGEVVNVLGQEQGVVMGQLDFDVLQRVRKSLPALQNRVL